MKLEENQNNNTTVAFNNNNIIINKLIDLLAFDNYLIYDTIFPLEFERNIKKLNLINNKRISPDSPSEKDFKNPFKFDESKEPKKEKIKKNSKLKKINEKKFNLDKNKSLINIKNKNCFNSELSLKNNYTTDNKRFSIEKCDHIYINNSSSQKDINKNKIKYIKEIDYSTDNHLNDNINKTSDLSQQIKIKKNHKIIFMNKSLIKKKKKKRDYTKNNSRKSIYRGVSKNGKNWQTIISYKKNIKYYGVYPSDEIAARAYDIISIKNRGIKAKTNFKYDLHQIQKISEINIDFNSKDINEKIIKFIKELGMYF